MKNILVTGATGFICSYLPPILSKQKFQITAAVGKNFSQSLSKPIRIVKVGNIDVKTNRQEALQGIDIVLHLAARAHIINETIPNPEAEFIEVNTQDTANFQLNNQCKQELSTFFYQFYRCDDN